MHNLATQAMSKVHQLEKEAQMNNKPVAWMAANELLFSVVKDEIYHIPLYTHPVKELTDEKITAISKKIFKDYKNFHHYQIDFARAVIKEVSAK